MESSTPGPGEADPVRERILEAFTERARTLGPHSVVMAELARDLGISTRTLYQHFRSKNDLVTAVVRSFARDWKAGHEEFMHRGLSPTERVRAGALAWVQTQIRFSRGFWDEVRRRYPDAWAEWQQTIGPVWVGSAKEIIPALREDLPPGLAFSLLLDAIRHAGNPDRCNRLGLSRQEAVEHAVGIWARGALKRPHLAVVRPPED